jgi:hypothetical protein
MCALARIRRNRKDISEKARFHGKIFCGGSLFQEHLKGTHLEVVENLLAQAEACGYQIVSN